MIEVIADGNGFRWTMICNQGRVLVTSSDLFPCVDSAATNAKAWRTTFWAIADQVDYRMARCI